MTVPTPDVDPVEILLGTTDARTAPQPETSYAVAESEPEPAPLPPPPKPSRKQPDLASLPPLTTNDPPAWRRHLHWLLVLALIPLAVSLLSKSSDETLGDKIDRTLENATQEEQSRFISQVKSNPTLDGLIEALPQKRVSGAFLPRSTYAHWGMAAAATALFLVFFMFLASDGSAKPQHVLVVGLITATVGVGFLLLVQLLASLTEGRIMVGRGIVTLLFWILKFIAFSYNAASEEGNGFLLSFIGFTLGVGLCEELVKTIPLLWHREDSEGKAWRGLFIWGLASGAGFGIAEGIMYSARYYNGIHGSGIYVVRFLSCVALHAIWTGSVAITLYLRRNTFDGLGAWYEWIGPLLAVVAVPMVLHGLYDTCLKREMNGIALLVAAASFGWLAFLSSRLYGSDDEAAKREMLQEYKRRKAALS
jgi:RsiW-degrading membrane proteinase PrsW (M82 family)